MNQFVEECRREWKRLRVPDPVAEEMAAELTADLDEAAAEGASPEEVLGSAASDPRSFAAAWAAERGVVPPQSLTARLRRRSLLPVAIAALTIVAAVGAALVVFASPNASAHRHFQIASAFTPSCLIIFRTRVAKSGSSLWPSTAALITPTLRVRIISITIVAPSPTIRCWSTIQRKSSSGPTTWCPPPTTVASE